MLQHIEPFFRYLHVNLKVLVLLWLSPIRMAKGNSKWNIKYHLEDQTWTGKIVKNE